AHPALDDLADAGRPPVLRLTTARAVDGAPFLYSALLAIPVPGVSPRAFLRGHLWAPTDRTSGRLAAAASLGAPARRFEALPWNGAPIAGRELPGFAAAADAAVRAMRLIPALPLVNWDVILAPQGPVFLEGNAVGNWILTCLGAETA